MPGHSLSHAFRGVLGAGIFLRGHGLNDTATKQYNLPTFPQWLVQHEGTAALLSHKRLNRYKRQDQAPPVTSTKS